MRWIIFGTGDVARKFVLDLAQAGHHVVAVASRNPENAARFAATLGLEAVTGDYDNMLKVQADGVYIATPPALHEPHALAAIAAGYAVLVEKPFAQDSAGATRIAEAAQSAGVFAMEAMWTRFQPLIGQVRQAIAAGELGDLRGFEARFLAANIPDPGTGLFDPGQGGGALLHRGIYPLSVGRHLLGPVEDVSAMAHMGDTGVDEEAVLVLRHVGGAISTVRASLRAQGPEPTAIWGTGGTLTLSGPVYRPLAGRLVPTNPARVRQGGQARRLEKLRESALGLRMSRGLGQLRAVKAGRRVKAPFAGNGYHYQAVAVAEARAAGLTESPLMPLAESIEILNLIDRARAVWSS